MDINSAFEREFKTEANYILHVKIKVINLYHLVYRSIAKHKKTLKKPHTFAKSWNILMPDMPLASVFDACSSTILHYDIL